MTQMYEAKEDRISFSWCPSKHGIYCHSATKVVQLNVRGAEVALKRKRSMGLFGPGPARQHAK